MASPPPAVVLASASPRRRELLERAGVRFEIRPSDVPEVRADGESPEAFARRLARSKAEHVAKGLDDRPRRWVLGADTIVVLCEQVLGKPRDAEDAAAMLALLVGREHTVITAVAVVETIGRTAREIAVQSRVRMRRAEASEIRSYVAGGEPLDKAGSYAVQGEGRRFVERVVGSETNVIGLPLDESLALLRAAGCDPARWAT